MNNIQSFFFIIFRFLFIQKIQIEYLNCTALIWAAANGYTEIVKQLLLQPKIDFNCINIFI